MVKKEIDWAVLDSILQFNASKKVCSDILEVSEDTIDRRIREIHDTTFIEYRDRKMGKVKIKLQQKAIEQALAGNATMMIFCLKNLCEWADKIETSTNEKKPFVLQYKLSNDKKPDEIT